MDLVERANLGPTRFAIHIKQFLGDIDRDNPPDEFEIVEQVIWTENGAQVTDEARHAELEAGWQAAQEV